MRKRTFYLASAAILGLGAMSTPGAQAAYVAIFQEVGSDVVETGSGSIDVTDLTKAGFFVVNSAEVRPNLPAYFSGAPGVSGDFYFGTSLSGIWGPGNDTSTSPSSGDFVAVGHLLGAGTIVVPQGCASGSKLSETSTYADASFSSLGMTVGQ